MSRWKRKNSGSYYTCSRSVHDKDTECAVGERCDERELEHVVYNAIGQHVSFAEKQAIQSRKVGKIRKTAMGELDRLFIRIYEDNVAGPSAMNGFP